MRASIAGRIDKVAFDTRVELAAAETTTVTFSPGAFPQLRFAQSACGW